MLLVHLHAGRGASPWLPGRLHAASPSHHKALTFLSATPRDMLTRPREGTQQYYPPGAKLDSQLDEHKRGNILRGLKPPTDADEYARRGRCAGTIGLERRGSCSR